MNNNPLSKPNSYKNCSSSECISISDLTPSSLEEIKKLVSDAVLKKET